MNRNLVMSAWFFNSLTMYRKAFGFCVQAKKNIFYPISKSRTTSNSLNVFEFKSGWHIWVWSHVCVCVYTRLYCWHRWSFPLLQMQSCSVVSKFTRFLRVFLVMFECFACYSRFLVTVRRFFSFLFFVELFFPLFLSFLPRLSFFFLYT